MSTTSSATGVLDKVEAVVANRAIYELATLIPKREPGEVGRPRNHPDYMAFIFDSLMSVFGSARKVEIELRHRYVWRILQRGVKKLFPNDPDMWLSGERYKRHHYEFMRNKYLTQPAMLEAIQEMHRKIATEQAQELGLLDPDGEGSFTHPSLDRLIYADGKVVTPLYKAKPGDTKANRETGEIKPIRFEPDAELHMEGTGEWTWGVKFLMTAVRSKDVHGRVILDADWCENKGGEANTAMRSFNRLAPHAPGIQGVVYDTALRGKHHAELMQRLGWLSINRVQAAEVNAKAGQKNAKRVEKVTHIEDKKVDGKIVRLYARAGALCVMELDYNGEHLVELKRLRTIRQETQSGTYRFYNEYLLPNGKTITVRIDTTEKDKSRKLNRSENLRQIAPSDPDFKAIYKRRNDAESINRQLDDSLWLRRAHSKGHKRQLLNMIGYALMVNSIALFLHRNRRAAIDENNSPSGEAPPVRR